ncbi:MAG: hypothetical protein ABI675_12255 [Chitinophagaceae bacterium]
MNKIFLFLLFSLLAEKNFAQCRKIIMTTFDNIIEVLYDKDGRLSMIQGDDDSEDEGPHAYHFITTAKGLTIPVNQEGLNVTDNGDGKYILVMGEEGHKSNFRINQNGQIEYWDYWMTEDDESSLKQTNYTYDAHGNLLKMVWDGKLSHATDHGELTATFNLRRPGILLKGGTMRFLAEMPVITFPMTNTNQITSWNYVQTITVAASTKVIGRDKQGNDIIKQIPEKKININKTKNFAYTYNSNGELTGIAVTGTGSKPATYKIKYSTDKCDDK